MNLIFLYDEFMRVPLGMEGNPVYIFDNTLSEGYELSEKIIENRYFLAKEAGAEIYQGNTYEILQEIHSQNPISKITTKATFRPVYQELFQKLGDAYDVEQLPDYFLLQDNYLHPAKRFFQYWNKIKKNLKY
ncbi:MAG: hypothetical protein CMI89_02055 [Pelagibacteraceae bacterium]|jgi:hypothetical protein|nr:hypothetical protein [Pelagibacteraceae bacterium]